MLVGRIQDESDSGDAVDPLLRNLKRYMQDAFKSVRFESLRVLSTRRDVDPEAIR